MDNSFLSSADTVDLFRQYVVPNYGRYSVNLVRGEGSNIWDAEGNKYFVENTMPSIQVLTKADIINNLIIIFIIINIFIVIAQSTKKINLGLFENNKYSIILSLSIFILLNLLIVIL